MSPANGSWIHYRFFFKRSHRMTSIEESGYQCGSEQDESRRGYPQGYQPKPFADQVKRLRQLFPELGTADEKLAQQPLPQGAESWFAMPRWQRIGLTYNEAFGRVCARISQTRKKFCNHV